jgi:NAD(P)-dependent dehydrogenase (short-subunit alcohol dehydrogenase family)
MSEIRSKVLAGRAALITGANRGLGLEIAQAFVEAGASVMLCARAAERLDSVGQELRARVREGQFVAWQTADVTEPDQVSKVVDKALEIFGKLHILVNNAGIYGPFGDIEAVDWAEWVRAIEVNLMGSVIPTRAVLPHFRSERYGKILQLSGGGATKPLPRMSAYAASKAAVVRFAETVAEECLGTGIDVNSIAPGALNTQMLEEVLAAGPDKVGTEFFIRAIEQKQSGGTPLESGANLAVFLASAASDGITGKLISAVWDTWPTWPNHLETLRSSDVYTLRRITEHDRNISLGNT